MDDEELLQAEQPQAQQPSRPGANHGRIVRRANGTFEMWQEPISGRGGRFVSMNESTATPEARRALGEMRSTLGVQSRVAPLAERHVQLGNTTPTGGWRQRAFNQERPEQTSGRPFPDFGITTSWYDGNFFNGPDRAGERSRLETMTGLEDEAVKASIRPGQGGQSNTIAEQQLFRGQFPSTNNLGPTNSVRAAALFVNRDLQQARIAAAEQWLRSHPDLSQFEGAWAREEARLRPQLEARYSLRFRTPSRGNSRAGSTIGSLVGRPNAPTPQRAPQRPRNVPSNFVWNAADQTWDEPD